MCLHLGITAQTHTIPDYCRVFNNFESFHIDYQSILSGAPAVDGRTHRTTHEEKEITSAILGQIMK